MRNSNGRQIPVRLIGEQHVQEDLGWIPTLADWLRCIEPEPWMMKVARWKMKRKIAERKKQQCPHCGKMVAYFRYEDLRPWYSKHACPDREYRATEKAVW